jgi:excisionase family DNA binding protein
MASGIGLKFEEIQAVFSTEEHRREFPPIMDVAGIARLVGISPKTVYFWISEGRLNGTFRKRGKHVLFWRDRVLDRIFNGPNWETDNE